MSFKAKGLDINFKPLLNFLINNIGKANKDLLGRINPFSKYLLIYYHIISSFFYNILYNKLNFGVIFVTDICSLYYGVYRLG